MFKAKPKLATATALDPRWAAVVARDAGADGQFWSAVRTTGASAAAPERVLLFDAGPGSAGRSVVFGDQRDAVDARKTSAGSRAIVAPARVGSSIRAQIRSIADSAI